MYSVAVSQVVVPGSVQRLKRLGYAANVVLKDVWPLTYPEEQSEINSDQQTSNPDPIPIVYLSVIKDDVGWDQ